MSNETVKYLTDVMKEQIALLTKQVNEIKTGLHTLETQLLHLSQNVVGGEPPTPTNVLDSGDSASQNDVRVDHELDQARTAFIGLLMNYLSPEVCPMAKGFLKPAIWTGGEAADYGKRLLQYQEDIARMDIEKLLKSPSGFYRDTVTKQPQLFIKAETVWFIFSQQSTQLLTDPPQPVPPTIQAFFVAENGEGISRFDLQGMSVEQLRVLFEQTKKAFDFLVS